jgi:hypothetical protein
MAISFHKYHRNRKTQGTPWCSFGFQVAVAYTLNLPPLFFITGIGPQTTSRLPFAVLHMANWREVDNLRPVGEYHSSSLYM